MNTTHSLYLDGVVLMLAHMKTTQTVPGWCDFNAHPHEHYTQTVSGWCGFNARPHKDYTDCTWMV